MSSSVSHPAGDQINVMSTFSVEFIITKYPTASQGWIRKRLKAVRPHWGRHKRYNGWLLCKESLSHARFSRGSHLILVTLCCEQDC